MKNFIMCFSIMVLLSAAINGQDKITIKPGPDEGKDAWFWSLPKFQEYNWGVPSDGNYGLHNVIRAESWIWFNGERTDTIRSAIQFDISALPEDSRIDSAKLNLFFFSNKGYTKQEGQNHCYVERIIEEWKEDKINWVNQPRTTQRDRLLLDRSSSNTSDYSIDITDFVKFFIEKPDSNFGLMLKMKDEKEYRGLTFASSDHTDKELRPELVIYFRKEN